MVRGACVYVRGLVYNSDWLVCTWPSTPAASLLFLSLAVNGSYSFLCGYLHTRSHTHMHTHTHAHPRTHTRTQAYISTVQGGLNEPSPGNAHLPSPCGEAPLFSGARFVVSHPSPPPPPSHRQDHEPGAANGAAISETPTGAVLWPQVLDQAAARMDQNAPQVRERVGMGGGPSTKPHVGNRATARRSHAVGVRGSRGGGWATSGRGHSVAVGVDFQQYAGELLIRLHATHLGLTL